MTSRIIRGTAAALALALFAVAALAQDVTGTWHATIDGDMGPVELTFTFRQEGERVSGSVAVGTTEADITDGYISGADLTFRLPWGDEPGDSPQVVISYQAVVSDDEMRIVSSFTGEPGSDPVVTQFTATRAR